MRLPRLVVKLHRWLGLLLGLQVILWITGGLVMSAVHIDKVRGQDRARESAAQPFPVDRLLLPPAAVADALGLETIDGLSLGRRLGDPVFQVRHGADLFVVHAATGETLPALTADQARAVAAADYAGPSPIARVDLLEEPVGEIRGRTPPLWRVEFGDGRRTTLYIHPDTGQVVARRNRLWRIYDVFWMLHIMDYRDREDFNHPLLVGSAAVAWFLSLSGAWLVGLWLRRRWRRRP